MVKQAKSKSVSGVRLRSLTPRQRRQKAKKQAQSRPAIASSRALFGQTVTIFRDYWRPLGGIFLVYLLLALALTGGFSWQSSVDRNHFSSVTDNIGSLFKSFGTNQGAGEAVLQALLVIVVSLVIIWSLRRLLAGNTVKVKTAYYSATAPLIPFVLVLAVIVLEIIPLAIGAAALGTVLSEPADTGGVILFSLIFAGSLWLSLYLMLGSLFGLYIVTLPNAQPWQALRSAANLVRYRRLSVLRKIVTLKIGTLVVMALLVVPLMLYVHDLAPPMLFGLVVLAIFFSHTYLYNLYRSLIR